MFRIIFFIDENYIVYILIICGKYYIKYDLIHVVYLSYPLLVFVEQNRILSCAGKILSSVQEFTFFGNAWILINIEILLQFSWENCDVFIKIVSQHTIICNDII